MAKAKTTKEVRKDVNEVAITGVVKRVNYISDKMASYNVQIETPTPKGNASYVWVDVIDFERTTDFEENDNVVIKGCLMTQSYEGKNGKVFKTVVKANGIEVI